MKKLQRLLLGLCLLSTPVIGQNVLAHAWAKDIGSTINDDETTAMITSGGYTYVTGYFKGNMTVTTTSGGNYTLASSGGPDLFVAKYDANNGNCVSITSTGGFSGTGITVVGSTIFFTGCNGSSSIAGKLSTTFANGAVPDIAGVPDIANAITTDGADVFITGRSSTGVFPTGPGTSITLAGATANGLDMMVAKFSPSNFNGSTLYWTNAVTPYNDDSEASGNGIAYYNGNLYVTGFFTGSMQVASSIPAVATYGYSDIFLVALSSSTLTFASQIRHGGCANTLATTAPWFDCGYSVAANANGIFVAGSSYVTNTQPIVFDSKSVGTSAISAAYSVLVKYPYMQGGTPGAAAWVDYVLPYANGTGSFSSCAYGVALTYNHVVMVNYQQFSTAAYFIGQNGTSVNLFNVNNSNGAVSVFNQTDGNYISAAFVQSTNNITLKSHPLTVTADPNCDKFQYGGGQDDAGRFGNTITSHTLPVGSGYDAFIASGNSTLWMTASTNACTGSDFQLNSSFTATGHCITTFSWSPASNLSCTTCQSPVFNSPTSGNTTYSLTVTSCNGCTYSGPVKITITTGIVANAGPDKKICPGMTTTTIGVNNGATTYSWAPASGLSCTNCATPTCSALGTYTLTTTSACGTTTDVVNVTAEFQNLCSNPGRMADPATEAPPVFSVYPNPGDGHFQLAFATDETHQVEVYDVAGQLIYAAPMTGLTGTLSLDENAKGMFIVKVSDKEGEVYSKIVVQ